MSNDQGTTGEHSPQFICNQTENSGNTESEVVVVFTPHQILDDEGPSSSMQMHDPLSMTVTISSMNDLPESCNKVCPIAMEDFDKARIDFLPEDACFLENRPDMCVATLPCGHRFNALSVMCHMVLTSMRCPVCR